MHRLPEAACAMCSVPLAAGLSSGTCYLGKTMQHMPPTHGVVTCWATLKRWAWGACPPRVAHHLCPPALHGADAELEVRVLAILALLRAPHAGSERAVQGSRSVQGVASGAGVGFGIAAIFAVDYLFCDRTAQIRAHDARKSNASPCTCRCAASASGAVGEGEGEGAAPVSLSMLLYRCFTEG